MTDPIRVLVHNDETDALVERLRAAHPDIEAQGCNSFAALPDTLAHFRPQVVYSVRFDATTPFPREALLSGNGVRWVANGGAGVDHLAPWDPDQITITNAAGVAADMMAEYVMGGFLHFMLDVPGLQKAQARKLWEARRVRPLFGKCLLVLGLGHTGKAVAARAKAFGMTVIGTKARPGPLENVDEVHGPDDLALLLPRADFIAVCTPLVPATRMLLNAGRLARVKPGVILADVSRGGVVDQSALLKMVQSGVVGAAILDVFEREPLPASSPLWAEENILISPHCSSVDADWESRSFDLFLKNLDLWKTGQPLINVVDPLRGY